MRCEVLLTFLIISMAVLTGSIYVGSSMMVKSPRRLKDMDFVSLAVF